MEIVVHRINSVARLQEVPVEFGCEIDIRAQGKELILNHEPFAGGERFINFLDAYQHGLLILNVKEAGIETAVLDLVRQRGIRNYFLLDVEFPYLYRAARAGERAIAIRYSEDESIETVKKYRGMVDWVWVDTNTVLPLDSGIIQQLYGFRTCLVCPERWGRPRDIIPYRQRMKALGFEPDAVMTSVAHAAVWQQAL